MFFIISNTKSIDLFRVPHCSKRMFFLHEKKKDHRMSEAQRELVKCIRKYRDLDDGLKKINSAANDIREKKKIVELEMTDILKRGEYSHVHKLDIQDDRSTIKIQRPSQWSKSWSLSLKELTTLVKEYFATTRAPTADECVKYISAKRREDLVSHEFSFSRMLAVEDKDGDVA